MTRARGASGSSALRLVGFVVAMAAILALSIGTAVLAYHRSDTARRAQETVADLKHDLDALRFGPQRFLYSAAPPAGAVAQVPGYRAQLALDARLLTRLAPSSLSDSIDRLALELNALNVQLLQLYARHDRAAVAKLDTTGIENKYGELASNLGVADVRLDRSAAGQRGAADRTIVLVMIAAMAANVVFALRYSCTRRRATSLASAEQALREGEERYRTLLQHSSDLTFVVDPMWVVTYASPATEHILGVAADELVGKSITDFVHADDLARELARTHEHTLQYGTIEARWRHADGTWRDVESVYTDLFDDPAINGMVINARDVTSRNQLERDLRRSQKLESVGLLSSGIAHEINTPVQFVGDNIRFFQEAFAKSFQLARGYQAILSSAEPMSWDERRIAMRQAEQGAELDYFATEVPAALTEALDGVDRIATIVRAMRSFGHPDGAEQRPTDINECLQDTLTVARNELKHVAEVETHFGELPLVMCFRGDINQVFLNLLVNAAHAISGAHPGELGRIVVRTSHQGDDVVITISDNGGGIPPELHERVFDQFFTTKGVGRGTGQGLAIARSVVTERHGGTIDFETVDGEGTSFSVHLPVAREAAAEVAA